MAERVAAALAIELQSYDIVAAVQPAPAPLQVDRHHEHARCRARHRHRDRDRMVPARQGRGAEGPAISRTVAQAREDYAEASDRLVSRIAQQAAPRVATLMGKPPTFEARVARPGRGRRQRADRAAGRSGAGDGDGGRAVPGAAAARVAQPPQPPAAHVKVMVAPVDRRAVGRQPPALSGMRRALGSSKIVVVDAAGADAFTVIGNGQADADRRAAAASSTSNGCSRTPPARNVGNLEQSNPVPLAAAQAARGRDSATSSRTAAVGRRARTARKGDQASRSQ